jgi:serine phosphatase RsbU (regulator of sigma subunit)/anti-sigma regulatory factor (Ser/Thr protein kinase)/anti-anti-sigma regulatory factor
MEGMDADPVRSAVEQAPYILIVCEGAALRLAGMNAAARALFPGRDALGEPLRDALADLAGQQWIDLYEQVYRTGEPAAGQEWRAHITLPDGTTRELFADFTITPWRHPDGRIRGVIGGGTDVTDIVRARNSAQREALELQEQYQRARDVVNTLQQALLPRGLPVLAGTRLAASYLLAGADTSAGGDWFDAVVQPDGAVALVVGDVVGHGVTASGVMGQLRAVLQDRLYGGATLPEALGAIDRLAGRLPAAHATTVCLAVLRPADGILTYCTAGHPPPLIVSADGTTSYLPVTGGGPLGTGSALPVRTARLNVGDLLLLYSDGIIERPGRTVTESTDELARVAADAVAGRALHAPDASPAERACTQTVELLVRATGYNDDITLLAAQRVAAPPVLDLQLPADLTRLRTLRGELRTWLDGLGTTEDDAFLLQHAVGELVTNAIEHSLSADLVGLHAELTTAGEAAVTVTDRGRWREPDRVSERGRGLALTTQLVDVLRLERTDAGTVATIRHRLSRPASMLNAASGAAHRPVDPDHGGKLSIEDDGDARVRVDGPVDATTGSQLQHELLYRSRGGTVDLTVDLTGVTHLASAGVAALHAVAERHRGHGTSLVLIAPADTIARHVLSLVALPHV